MNDFIDIAKKRAQFIRIIHDFFLENEYCEVETPILSPFLLPEPSIEAFKTEYIDGYGGKVPCFLIPSPEVWMKRLLARGFQHIYQITRCFRNGESQSEVHNPEFTMCEWYSVNADYMDSGAFTGELFNYIYSHLPFESAYDIRPPFIKLSMKQAFRRYCDIDLDEFLEDPGNHPVCEKLSIHTSDSSTPEEIFNKLFLTYVEPFLPHDKPVMLYDYPGCIPVLAKPKDAGDYYERWELYIKGIEVANCYTEETDRDRVAEFIKKEGERKKDASVLPVIDRNFDALFHSSYPDCSGVALGIDRLFMIISGINSIGGVILFPFSSIID